MLSGRTTLNTPRPVFLILPALFCVLLGPMMVKIISRGGLF